ncbi:hypothetical protein RRG08_049434 [Elysia crispata]|uniref:Uncharacterized protein n=1 Tax=Elysia crispata TaxID=231223 RepID=A0AAE0ZSI1_9GAST|nr:hypothetical protein RRG08_049434 [Elysia crispata]
MKPSLLELEMDIEAPYSRHSCVNTHARHRWSCARQAPRSLPVTSPRLEGYRVATVENSPLAVCHSNCWSWCEFHPADEDHVISNRQDGGALAE